MNTANNYTTIHLQLNQIDVLEVVTLNNFSYEVCVPNKTGDLNLSMFNKITGTNESKTLLKDISCKCKYRFNGRKCKSDKWWNNSKC